MLRTKAAGVGQLEAAPTMTCSFVQAEFHLRQFHVSYSFKLFARRIAFLHVQDNDGDELDSS